MEAAVPVYKRVPGSGLRSSGPVSMTAIRCSLWMASDHLLCVDRQLANEQYKRFYYRDIQAILIRPTNRTRNYNIAFALVIAAFMLAGLAIGGGGIVFFGLLALVAAVIMIVNSAKGPCCSCHLRTAVQTEELPSLSRLYNAEKAVALLRPLIEQAQGTLKPEDVQIIASQAPQVSVGPAALSHKARPAEVLKHDKGVLHTILFWAVILNAVTCLVSGIIGEVLFGILGAVLFCSNLLLSLLSTIKQSRTDISAAVKRTVWFILIFMCVDAYIILVVTGGVAGFKHAQQHQTGPMAQPQFADFMTVASHPVSAGISGTVLFICGAYGLFSLYKFRQQYEESQRRSVAVMPESATTIAPPSAVKLSRPESSQAGSVSSTANTPPANEPTNTKQESGGGSSSNA